MSIACESKSATSTESNSGDPTKAATKVEKSGPQVAADPAMAFPQSLGQWKLAGVKTKTKDWGKAYSSTYKSGKDELKVVINDAPPKGVPAWDAFFTGQKLDGRPMTLDVKDDKITLMVRVQERFRVDFKSRNPEETGLEELAKQFDFGKVEALAK